MPITIKTSSINIKDDDSYSPIDVFFGGDIQESVDSWLELHPEAITPVADGSITQKKLVVGTLGYVTPEMFGAVGDSTTDDTSALQNMFDFAASNNLNVFGFKKVNYLSGAITIPSGIPRVEIVGKIVDNGVTKTALVSLGTSENPFSNSVVTLNVVVSANTNRGIYGKNVSNTVITKCNIESGGVGAKKYLLSLQSSEYITIENCKLKNDFNPTGEFQIGIILYGDYNIDYAGYFDNGDGSFTACSNPSKNNIIKNNTILNGTHGIVINGGVKNIVDSNYIAYSSHRCIALEPGTFNNLISNNQLHAFGSTGVLMAYGADGNEISNNVLTDDLDKFPAGGEGAIVGYVGIKNCKIIGNYIDSRRNYGIYMAIDVINNTVSENTVRNYRVAGIALECDWIPSGGTITDSTLPTDAKFSRRFASSVIYDSNGNQVDYWAYNNSSGNKIVNNDFYTADVDARPQLYLCQMGNRVKLNFNIIKGNRFSNLTVSSSYHLYCFEDTSVYFINNTLEDNSFINSYGLPNRYYINGYYYFTNRSGNEYLDDGVMTVSGSTIDVMKGETFVCSNESATTITSITNGRERKQIFIVFDANTTLKNNSNIKLKNATDAVGVADGIMTLVNRNTKWYEVSRSF